VVYVHCSQICYVVYFRATFVLLYGRLDRDDCIILRLELSPQTAKDAIQSEAKRHCLTSLTPADEMNDVMRDVRARDSKSASADVTDQAGIRRDIAVRTIFYDTPITVS